jgi:hypothetical protein
VSQTTVITPDLGLAAWQYLPISFLPEDFFTGTVTVQFQVRDDGDGAARTLYLDEVSLGHSPGGPYRSYLPVVLRGF